MLLAAADMICTDETKGTIDVGDVAATGVGAMYDEAEKSVSACEYAVSSVKVMVMAVDC